MRVQEIKFYADFKKLDLSLEEFKKAYELPEYSGTRPTGVTNGKRWRRHDGVYARDGIPPVWLICEYEVFEQTQTYVTHHYRPRVRVKAPTTRMVLRPRPLPERTQWDDEIKPWCMEQLGYIPKWVVASHLQFYLNFKTTSDAVAFQLRWGGV